MHTLATNIAKHKKNLTSFSDSNIEISFEEEQIQTSNQMLPSAKTINYPTTASTTTSASKFIHNKSPLKGINNAEKFFEPLDIIEHALH